MKVALTKDNNMEIITKEYKVLTSNNIRGCDKYVLTRYIPMYRYVVLGIKLPWLTFTSYLGVVNATACYTKEHDKRGYVWFTVSEGAQHYILQQLGENNYVK